ncbi:calcium permease family membrane transporter-like protein [Lentithecium fluviatile CBS 122367]|uniref:Calcium permease family membrane transporter-like protein n=1 Tax=Lentithecium fluviatile CBS 122367 TaxID=1168545 RepID=A0A6G1IKJ9_9PLEO|nr:calcium permease family membrane transporter-like protein [Lentithecium fluviatile CBS 122367]
MGEGDRPPTAGKSNPPSASLSRRTSDYGVDSPSSSQHTAATSSEGTRRRPQMSTSQTAGYGSITSPLDRRNPNTTAPEQPKAKKPAMSRRTTSAKFPHKGQEFSVDDGEDEIDKELTEKQAPKKPSPSSSQTLRRKPSTIRRRTAAQVPALATVNSTDDDDAMEQESAAAPTSADMQPSSSGEDTLRAEEDTSSGNGAEDDDDEGDISDAESFTLKDRQEAINVTHPFGIRIWKPALYKKDRSVQRNAEGDIHSTPGLLVHNWLLLFNIAWTLIFGWWLALITAAGGLLCALFWFADSCTEYSQLLFHLAGYLFFPFGKYVKLMQDEAYAEEDEGEGRSISEYEQWQSGDIEEGRLFFGPSEGSGSLVGRRRNSVDSTNETTSLLGRDGRAHLSHSETARTKRRLFGRGKWNFGRVVFFLFFYGVFTPALLIVSGLCWFMVFTIPMGKVTLLLFDHLRRHPLALSFHTDSGNVRRPGESSSILLCTYRAVGIKYWKYTIDGTNIFLFNLLGLVAFVIFDYWVLDVGFGLKIALTDQFLVFTLALFSIIPLAYFIGQAVASISAQSSMGVGATINAFFSTVVEVYLYCVALNEGKAALVEGSIIGSIFAGILFLPGLSMCFGALKRKTQRFNVKSAGVTSTMLLFAVIGAFGPTLFYQIYGSHELQCSLCVRNHRTPQESDCRQCFYSQTPAINSTFFNDAVKPYIWFCAALLFLSYLIGLLFTLRTHAAVIWSSEPDEKKPADLSASQLSHNGQFELPNTLTRQATSSSIRPENIRSTQFYKRLLGQTMPQAGQREGENAEPRRPTSKSDGQTPHVVPPKDGDDRPSSSGFHLDGLSERDNQSLVRQITEIAAATTAIATRDAIRAPRKTAQMASVPVKGQTERPHHHRTGTVDGHDEAPPGHAGGGHDAPNWSRAKSSAILLTATIAYAVIAEILVNTVDAVLEGSDIDEKFLGITLFALVPNTTEFLNAISFAMNGNIALSMEIGSAYALQVLLLQIPALVFYSAIHNLYIDESQIVNQSFTLIFPQWDMVTVILCVFLLSYMYGEGKSNYFKGSILILSYFVVIVGFHLSSYIDPERMGVNPMDTLAVGGMLDERFESMSFKTMGQGRGGQAY